jgi:serine carboxypeptidase-like clade 1
MSVKRLLNTEAANHKTTQRNIALCILLTFHTMSNRFLIVALCAVFSCFICTSFVCADIPDDLITSLPGFSGALPTKQYSGLIQVPGTQKYLHYWFVVSQNEPSSDPVVLWLNGGPGCSSLDGWFYEHGPLHFNNKVVNGLPQLQVNPYSWNKVANILYLEAPAGVGFSFSENPSVDYNTNDNITAADNWAVLNSFFKSYSEFSSNDFYITGESYGGVYVPTLAYEVYNQNQAGKSSINLKGIAVGNGCTGNEVGSCSPQGTGILVDFLYGHGLYSTLTYQLIQDSCPDLSNPSTNCQAALNQMGNEVSDVNIYDIYDVCINGGMPNSTTSLNIRHRAPVDILKHFQRMKAKGVRGPDECIDGTLAAQYLNNAAVRKAIHVPDSIKIPEWTICTDNLNYDENSANLPKSVYPTLIENYRVLIYNGDVDACVPYNGNEAWTSGMGFPVKKGWSAWEINSQVQGYVTDYQVDTQFSFVTVKGAGHPVPQYQPAAALHLFTQFLRNQPLN